MRDDNSHRTKAGRTSFIPEYMLSCLVLLSPAESDLKEIGSSSPPLAPFLPYSSFCFWLVCKGQLALCWPRSGYALALQNEIHRASHSLTIECLLSKSDLIGEEWLGDAPEEVQGFRFLSHSFLWLIHMLFNKEWLVLPCVVLWMIQTQRCLI